MRSYIQNQAVTKYQLRYSGQFHFFPFCVPFCHLKRENSGTANSVLNSFSFWAQTRFLTTSNGEIHPKEIFSALSLSKMGCGVILLLLQGLKRTFFCIVKIGTSQGLDVLQSLWRLPQRPNMCKQAYLISQLTEYKKGESMVFYHTPFGPPGYGLFSGKYKILTCFFGHF